MKYEDRPDILEDISAFMDDELPPDEGAALVDRMLEDETLRRRWGHYHLIGDMLRGIDCRMQTALDDEDSLSARVAEEIEEIEDERSKGQADALHPHRRDGVASPIPIYRSRPSAHSHPSTPSSSPSSPRILSTTDPCDRLPKTPSPSPSKSPKPSKPRSRPWSSAGPLLVASIAVIAILGVAIIPLSGKDSAYRETSSAAMDSSPASEGDAISNEEAIWTVAPASLDIPSAKGAPTGAQDSSYLINAYLLRRAGYQGFAVQSMMGYGHIVGDRTPAH